MAPFYLAGLSSEKQLIQLEMFTDFEDDQVIIIIIYWKKCVIEFIIIFFFTIIFIVLKFAINTCPRTNYCTFV